MTRDSSRTSWSRRIDLARRGWLTEVRLSRMGVGSSPPSVVAAGVWARSWYWSGWITDICLHDHAVIDLAKGGAAARVAQLVDSVAETCARAEAQYRDVIPCQLADRDPEGRIILAASTWALKSCEGSPRIFYPTETIADGIDEGDDAHLDALVDAAERGLEVEDRIDCYFGRPRFARDCKDRDWGYRVSLAMLASAGVKVGYRPIELTTRLLAPGAAAVLAATAQASVLDLFEGHAPGGQLHGRTGNGLPPGFLTLAETLAKMDAAAGKESQDR